VAFIRAYQMRAQMGRGPRKGDPFLGALAMLAAPLVKKGLKSVLGKVGTKALTAAKGFTMGAGAIPRVVGPIRQAGATPVLPGGFRATLPRGQEQLGLTSGRKRYRRMNAGNAKALRRAFRRIASFSKLASKAGYVRRKAHVTRRETGGKA